MFIKPVGGLSVLYPAGIKYR